MTNNCMVGPKTNKPILDSLQNVFENYQKADERFIDAERFFKLNKSETYQFFENYGIGFWKFVEVDVDKGEGKYSRYAGIVVDIEVSSDKISYSIINSLELLRFDSKKFKTGEAALNFNTKIKRFDNILDGSIKSIKPIELSGLNIFA